MPDNNFIIASHSLFAELLKLIEMGGPVMIILLGMSIFTLSLIVFKLIQFQYNAIYSFKRINHALKEWHIGNYKSAFAQLKKSRNPAARIMETAFIGVNKNFEQALIREEVARIANVTMVNLRSYLRAIEVIAILSPLLGLFGTVLGIIDAFHELEKAGSNIDPGMLSGGIRVALLTTAAGLAVGMPAVAALNWLESKLERFMHLTENSITQIFTFSLAIHFKQPAIFNGHDQDNVEHKSYA